MKSGSRAAARLVLRLRPMRSTTSRTLTFASLASLASLAVLAAGCDFGGGNSVADDQADDTGDDSGDDDAPLPDAGIDALVIDHVDHLDTSIEEQLTGTADWMPAGLVTIDTGTGEITPEPPEGVVVLV